MNEKGKESFFYYWHLGVHVKPGLWDWWFWDHHAPVVGGATRQCDARRRRPSVGSGESMQKACSVSRKSAEVLNGVYAALKHRKLLNSRTTERDQYCTFANWHEWSHWIMNGPAAEPDELIMRPLKNIDSLASFCASRTPSVHTTHIILIRPGETLRDTYILVYHRWQCNVRRSVATIGPLPGEFESSRVPHRFA